MLFAHSSYELSQLSCACPLSAPNLFSRLFWIVLQILGTSVSKLGFLLMLNVRILGNFTRLRR